MSDPKREELQVELNRALAAADACGDEPLADAIRRGRCKARHELEHARELAATARRLSREAQRNQSDSDRLNDLEHLAAWLDTRVPEEWEAMYRG